jgi:hypothetical protein
MRSLLRTLLLFIALWCATRSYAGSGTAKLTCTSASGRTVFTAYLQDIEGMFEGGELTIDGKTLRFPGEDVVGSSAVIWDPDHGVFTLSFTRPGEEQYLFIRFWAIPNTFQVISNDRGSAEGARYAFEAILEATEPREGKGHATPLIRLTCNLEYRI